MGKECELHSCTWGSKEKNGEPMPHSRGSQIPGVPSQQQRLVSTKVPSVGVGELSVSFGSVGDELTNVDA